MNTPLFPIFQKRINDSFEILLKNQVTPWVFLNSGKRIKVMTYDKRKIFYEGIVFEGSPENVFLGRYIEPFMEEITINEIGIALNMATEKNVDAKILLSEVESLLLAGVREVFTEMATIDQCLKGRFYRFFNGNHNHLTINCLF